MPKRTAKPKLRVFWSDDFKGVNPVGTAAVMVAANRRKARQMLEGAHSLATKHQYTLHELDTTFESVLVLRDGDYRSG